MPRKPGRRKVTTARDLGWQDRAECRGQSLHLFFPAEGERKAEKDAREARAKPFCDRCPVRHECFEYALTRPEKDGFWGGVNEEVRAVEWRNRPRRKGARQTAEDAA